MSDAREPTISKYRFATAVSCIDGRFHESLVKWMKDTFSVDHVDLITLAGVDRQLLVGDDTLRANIRRRVTVSHEAHGSRTLVIAAHEDCAGNPCDRHRHEAYLNGCVDLAATWELPMRILGVYQPEESDIDVIVDTETP